MVDVGGFAGSSRAWLARGVAVIVLIASTAVARAQARSGADLESARALTGEGIAAQERHEYDHAIERFTQAFALAPHPILLFNIAQCHRLAGRGDRAIRLYERYLETDPDGREAEAARAHLAALKRVAPAPAAPVPETAKTGLPSENPPLQFDEPVKPTPRREPGRRYRIGAATAGVLGALSLGTAIGYQLRIDSIERDFAMIGRPTNEEVQEARAEGNAAQRNGRIALTIGIVFAAGSGVLWWLGRREDRAAQRTAIAPLVAPDFGGFAVIGTL